MTTGLRVFLKPKYLVNEPNILFTFSITDSFRYILFISLSGSTPSTAVAERAN